MATKRKKPTRSPKSGNSNGSLLEIAALRSNTKYQAAEQLRRKTGDAKLMARASETSDEYAAVRLLIGTWETIAMRYEAGGFTDDEFFRGLPIGYMWNALKDAIGIVRAAMGEKAGKEYARSFQGLSNTYDAWRKKSDKQYDSGADSGIHALFG